MLQRSGRGANSSKKVKGKSEFRILAFYLITFAFYKCDPAQVGKAAFIFQRVYHSATPAIRVRAGGGT